MSASLFGVFTVQFLELELVTEPEVSLDIRGGFSLTLGPFAASIDRVGVSLASSSSATTSSTSATSSASLPPGASG